MQIKVSYACVVVSCQQNSSRSSINGQLRVGIRSILLGVLLERFPSDFPSPTEELNAPITINLRIDIPSGL